MSALFEPYHRVLTYLGTGIAVVGRDRCERRKNVQHGYGLSGALDAVEIERDVLTDVVEQLILDGYRAILGGQYACFELLELGGYISLGVGERLFSYVSLGHHVLVRIGDLDIIAEHAVVADLELWYAGQLLLFGLDAGEQGGRIGHVALDLVERRRVALADEASLAHRERRVVDDGRIYQLAHIFKRVDIFVYLAQEL